MKTIYVMRDVFGFRGITKEEAEEGIESGSLGGVSMTMERPGGDDIVIYVLTRIFFGRLTEATATSLQKAYFEYVESITGMATYPKEES